MELELCNITKNYGQTCALEKVQLRFQPGIYGLLGPNGAGKSTLMQIITGNLSPTEGTVWWNKKSIESMVSSYSKELGYVPQNQGLYSNFTARQFLWYMAALKALPRKQAKQQIGDLLVQMGLDRVANRKLGSFSGGMRQRILIAQALLGNPKLIVLDEPTAGLDPVERIHIRNFISTLSSRCIVLFATHVVSDVEGIAHKIVLLNHGNVLAFAPPSELCESIQNHVFLLHTDISCMEEVRKDYFIGSIFKNGQNVTLRLIPKNLGSETNNRFFALLRPAVPTLEDVYLASIGESGRSDFSERSAGTDVLL